jgi:hypothetical protein
MKIMSTVTTSALANAWKRFGSWPKMDGGSRTTATGLLPRHPERVGLLDLADDVLHGLLHLLHRAAPAGPAKVRDPVLDVQAVSRQLIRERHELVGERPAYPAQDRKREEDRHEDRRHPTQPSPLERPTTGLRRNVSRTERASGISTGCSQYKPATTSAKIPHR